ncbi:MAG: biopolymer transporter ExbD, partial [Acidimicrobiales bacterium]
MGPVGGTRGLASGINVTPLIDVLLVLLIIFMLVERYHLVIPAHLPREARGDDPGPERIVLELPREGGYRINGTPAAAAELGSRLAAIFEPRRG